MSKGLVVDRELLFEFLIIAPEEIADEHLNEVDKVISIVLNKYHSSQYQFFEECRAQIMITILERRDRFDPKYDAYNYIFTIARNESGNYIKKLTKEASLDETSTQVEDKGSLELEYDPMSPLKPYVAYLAGYADYNYIRISRESAVDLLVYLKSHDPTMKLSKREFTQREAQAMFYLLKKYLN